MGKWLSPEAVTGLNRTTDLSPWATKQTAAVIGCSMVAMEAMERHLYLVHIKKKEKKQSPPLSFLACL